MDPERFKQLTGTMVDLCSELESIVERATPIVEELDNSYGIVCLRPELPADVRRTFAILQALIVGK
jgi:hypothetical protein